MLKDELACLFVLNPFLEPTSIKQLGFLDQEKKPEAFAGSQTYDWQTSIDYKSDALPTAHTATLFGLTCIDYKSDALPTAHTATIFGLTCVIYSKW